MPAAHDTTAAEAKHSSIGCKAALGWQAESSFGPVFLPLASPPSIPTLIPLYSRYRYAVSYNIFIQSVFFFSFSFVVSVVDFPGTAVTEFLVPDDLFQDVVCSFDVRGKARSSVEILAVETALPQGRDASNHKDVKRYLLLK